MNNGTFIYLYTAITNYCSAVYLYTTVYLNEINQPLYNIFFCIRYYKIVLVKGLGEGTVTDGWVYRQDIDIIREPWPSGNTLAW